MSKYKLKAVLEKFRPRLAYKELDRKALEISRSAAAGNMGDSDDNYAEWAMISDDPLVIVNYVKTYITTQVSKLSGAPFRPESDNLLKIGIDSRLDSVFVETYTDVLNDGYAYVGVGMQDNAPVVKPIDARYIMFNGDDPTLRDATDVVVFEVVPLSLDKDEAEKCLQGCNFLGTYVEYDSNSERVKVSHYHKEKKTGQYVLDIYDEDYEHPTCYSLPGLDRIPVIRFVGERIELNDRRYHYRGIYYQMASVLKALALVATKIQIRTAASSDANFIARNDAIANHNETWKNTGTLPIDNVDSNGNDIPPFQFVPHDNEFLIQAFETWKAVIADMLGPTVASGSEAVTREEVIARNEVKDAISNTYLSRMANSIEEVYRCIQMYMFKDTKKVVILGGYIESVKRKKDLEALMRVYSLAKEGGLNTQGIVVQALALEDLPPLTKQAIAASFQQDPFKSPQVLQLQNTVQALNQTIQRQNQQIALLRLQATQRLERQKEFIDSTERTKRLELALKQWTEEQKQTQEALMAILNDCLSKGDYDGAIQTLEQIKQQDAPMLTNNILNLAANSFSEENAKSVASALQETGQQIAPPMQPSGMPSVRSPQPVPVAMTQADRQMANINAPAPRPAVTVFDDA